MSTAAAHELELMLVPRLQSATRQSCGSHGMLILDVLYYRLRGILRDMDVRLRGICTMGLRDGTASGPRIMVSIFSETCRKSYSYVEIGVFIGHAHH